MGGTSDHLPLAMAAVAAGSLVQGILGFGCSLVWMSIFPLFTSVPDAVGVLQPLAISLNALLLSRTYRHAALRDLRPLALSAPVGMAFGLWVVTSWSARAVNGLLGSFLLLYTCHGSKAGRKGADDSRIEAQAELVEEGGDDADESESGSRAMLDLDEAEAESLVAKSPDDAPPQQPSALRPCRSSPTSVAAGFVGGCLTSAFGTGGPPVLIYAREAGWEAEPDRFRANLQVIFFAMNVLAISMQCASGIIDTETARSSALLVPALAAGGVVGSKLAHRVSRGAFRTLVVNGLRVMGVLFVTKALR